VRAGEALTTPGAATARPVWVCNRAPWSICSQRAGVVHAGARGDLGQERVGRHAGEGVDLEDVLVFAFGHEHVDAGGAGAAEGVVGPLGEAQHALVPRGGEPGGEEVLREAALNLGLVVKEGPTGHDLDGAEDAAVDDAHVHLLRADEALDEHAVVVAEGEVDGGAQLGEVVGAAHADGAALAAGLHHHGETKRAVALLKLGIGHGAGEVVVGRRRHVVEAKQLLGLELVHGQGRGEHAGARVGDAHPLEQALNGAVFAVAAVEGEEGHVDGGAAERLVDVAVDEDGRDGVAAAAERFDDGLARAQRHLALGRNPSQQDANSCHVLNAPSGSSDGPSGPYDPRWVSGARGGPDAPPTPPASVMPGRRAAP
jgi:hypothetical protein